MWIRKDAVYKNVSEHRFNTQYKAMGYEPVPEEQPKKEIQLVEAESSPVQAETVTDYGLKEHDVQENPSVAFTCHVCGKEYKTERGLANHMTTHEDGEQDA